MSFFQYLTNLLVSTFLSAKPFFSTEIKHFLKYRYFVYLLSFLPKTYDSHLPVCLFLRVPLGQRFVAVAAAFVAVAAAFVAVAAAFVAAAFVAFVAAAFVAVAAAAFVAVAAAFVAVAAAFFAEADSQSPVCLFLRVPLGQRGGILFYNVIFSLK